MAQFHPTIIGLGWIGGLLTIAHPVKPNPATAVAALVGFPFWFQAGFFMVIAAVWGA